MFFVVPPAGEGPLVGRARECNELREAFDAAARGHGGVQLVLGDPGVGKRRLAAALAEHATNRGARAIWTRGWGRAAPAYWPWVEVVRLLSHDIGGEALRAELGAAADQLLRLVPELEERLPDAAPPPRDSEDSEIARFALFDALVALLRARSAVAPVVVLINDLELVDEGSLVALDFISRMLRDARVLIVVTMHERAPRRPAEADAALQNIVQAGRSVRLRGLGRDDVGRLVEQISGEPATPALVQAVHTVTEGNPYYVREIVALLLAEERLHDPPDELPLPDSVREAIRRRVEPLDDDALQTLQLAAVIGRSFGLATLEHASPLDRDRVLTALDDAAALGLVAAADDSMTALYRFDHGLIRETLVEDMPAAERMARHGAVGEALEQVYRGAIDAHLPELAHHFLSALPRGDVARAVDYAERAGERALQTLAYEQAAEIYALSLEGLDSLPPDPSRRARLLLGLGTAQSRSGRPASRATFEQAVMVARQIEADDVFARAALGFAPFALTPGQVDEPHVALLEEALERVGDGDDAMRVRLLGSLAVALYWSDSAPRRATLAAEGLRIARRLDDDATLAIALCSAQLATSGPDASEQGLRWLDELFALTARGGETVMSLAARSRHVDVLLELDDLAGADIAIEALERLAREYRDPRAVGFVPAQRARRATMDGRLEDAERLHAEVVAIAEQLPTSTIPITAASQRVVLTWLAQGPREIGSQVRAYAAAQPAMPCWRAGLAAALADGGRDDEARLELDRLVADDFASIPRDNLWLAAMTLLCEAISKLDLPEQALQLHAQLAPFSGRNVVLPTVAFLGPVELWLGVLARVAGRDAEALEQFAAARTRARRLGARTSQVRIDVEEAAVLLGDSGEAGRRRAGELLQRAASAAAEIGLQRIGELVAALRERAAASAPASAPAAAEIGDAGLRRRGDVWTIQARGRTARVHDSKGVHRLALLLQRPGAEIHSLDLIAAADGVAPLGTGPRHSGERETSRRDGLQGGSGPALDPQAKGEYVRRIELLEAQLRRAQARRDAAAAHDVAREIGIVRRELERAQGLGGRDRQQGGHAERARLNVSRSISLLLARIVEQDALLGGELQQSVRTGTFCSYMLDPRRPLHWTVER